MDRVSRLNPLKITDKGYYFDPDNGVMFQLSDREIEEARNYFQMPDLAPNYVISKKTSQNRNYKIAKDQKYNDGRCRKRGRQRKSSASVRTMVISGILCIVTVYGTFLVTKSNSRAFNSDDISYHQEIEEHQTTQLSSMQYYSAPKVVLSEDEKIEGNEEVSTSLEVGANPIVDENYERRAWVEKYCSIYQVDFNKTYQKLVELTNNFTSSDYLSGHIVGVTCKGEDVYASSEEELILYFVRCVKQLPSQLGLDTGGLLVNTGYVSSSDYASEIGYYNRLLGVDPLLSYAITQSETGWDSDLFLNANNPAGLRIDGHWWNFSSKEEGFIELALEILKYNRKGAYTIEEIGSIHAPLSDGNENWIPNVTSVYYTISNDSVLLEKLQGTNENEFTK